MKRIILVMDMFRDGSHVQWEELEYNTKNLKYAYKEVRRGVIDYIFVIEKEEDKKDIWLGNMNLWEADRRLESGRKDKKQKKISDYS